MSTRGADSAEKTGSPGTAPGGARPGLADDVTRIPSLSEARAEARLHATNRPDAAETETVRRAGAGDREAFRELVEQHQNRVLRLVTRMLRCNRELAEDLCQEVFLRAWKALPRFDGAVRFQTWVRKITVNACITEIRKQRAAKRDAPTMSIDAPRAGRPGEEDGRGLDPAEGRPGTDPGDRAHQLEFKEAVRHALAELPEDFRSAVLLRDLEGLSYEEIGVILGVPAGTVRSRIYRGRVQLQELLKEYRP